MKESKSSQDTIRNRNVSLAERRAWTIPPDDLPAGAEGKAAQRQLMKKEFQRAANQKASAEAANCDLKS